MKRLPALLACAATAGASLVAALSGHSTPSAEAGATPPGAIASALPAAQAGVGTIKGRLVWGGSTIPQPNKVDIQGKDPQVCGKKPLYDPKLLVDEKTKGVANFFAYVVNPKGSNPEKLKDLLAKAPKVTIDNKDCQFVPYATAAHKDQVFEFTSSDAIGHNVHYTGFTNGKNFALSAQGKADQKLVMEKHTIELKCDIHPWMKGEIMVFDHPFFTITREDGSFEITGVPAGAQKLILRNKDIGFVTPNTGAGLAVTVKPGETVDVGEIKLDPSKVK